jgi:pimeloyl-ACP methyl ester carboxylesterase
MPAHVVLVHGAFHGAWCFERTLPLLDKAGVEATAVDLPGHGEDRGAFEDLHGDARRVTETIDGLDGEVVLLGHSYGGAVVTEAGVHPRVRHVIYLCALAIDADETCAAAAVDESKDVDHTGRRGLGEVLVTHDDGTASLGEDGVRMLYNDCDEETIGWAAMHMGRQPMLNLTQSPDAVAWRAKPTTYVVCTEDLAVHPDLQRILARRCTTTVEWTTSHSPFASRPELLAELVAQLSG